MPEAGGGCLGDLGLDKRQLLKGWPDLWLAGDNTTVHRAVVAPPPLEPDQTLALPDTLLLRVLTCLPEPHLARERNGGRGE
jgi:F-box/leucine-rich repeat protein 2/20